MKRCFLSLLIALLSVGCVWAYDFKQGSFYYNLLTTSTVEVTYDDDYLDLYSGDVTIPATVKHNNKTYNVVAVGDEAFYECTGLTSITFGSNIASLGNGAFEGCTSLTDVTIPSGVTVLPENAFYGCSSLTSVSLPSGLTSLGVSAFDGCSSLTSVSLPVGITELPDYVFYGTGLTSVDLPDNVTSIGYGAFQSCSNLASVTIGKNITLIGSEAFSNCSKMKHLTWNAINCAAYPFGTLETVAIGDQVENIPENLCNGESNLKSVTFGANVKTIGKSAFEECFRLTSVTLPARLTSLGENAFYGCSSLTSVSLPDGLTSMGVSAFDACSKLTAITIPSGITELPDYVFYGTGLTSVVIPDNVTSIGYGAFQSCSSLASVTIGKNITLIGSEAFSDCSKMKHLTWNALNCAAYHFGTLETVIIGDQVVNVPNKLCEEESNLVSVTFGSNVRNIGIDAFYSCSGLTSIVLPASVTDIGDYAFGDCSGLTSITCYATTPPRASADVFDGVDKTIPVNVPMASANLYHSANGWHDFWYINGMETPVTEVYNIEACDSYYWAAADMIITASGTYVHGNVALNVLILSSSVTTAMPVMACESYYWAEADTTILTSGMYSHVFSSISGCESVVNLPVTIYHPYAITLEATVSEEQLPYVWEGQTFTAAGTKTLNLVAASGCDSVVTLVLSVVPDGWDPEHPENPGNYQLSLNVNDEAMGSVTGAGLYPQNTTVDISAVPAEGHYFVRWSDNNTDASRSVVLSQDMALTAYFEVYRYSIVFANNDGSVLQQTEEPYGAMPAYLGPLPQHQSHAIATEAVIDDLDPRANRYDYTFIGWKPQIVPVVAAATYVAQYDSVLLALDTVIVTGNEDIADLLVGSMTHVIVTETGHLTISAPAAVASLTLMADSLCGQVSGIENLSVASADMVLRLNMASGDIASRWFAFAVPFEVSVASGIRMEGAAQAAVAGRDFVLDEYNGALRASAQDGWQRVNAAATLVPGKLYMVASANATQWRMTALHPEALSENDNVAVSAYQSGFGAHHSGWNGIANPMWSKAYAQMEGINYATLYNNYYGLYEVVPMSEYKPSAAMPFFVQAPADGYVVFGESASPDMAPMRVELSSSDNMTYTVELSEVNTSYSDKAYMTLSENKDNRYVIGRDLEKMQVAAPAAPQVWLEAYGTRLAAHEALMLDNRSSVQVGLYAPQDGTYMLSMSRLPDNTTIYLTYLGQEIWNLSLNPYSIELTQGDNADYGLSIHYAPQIITGITDTDSGNADVQKVLKDNQILILRGGKTYTIQGQELK